MGPRGLRWALAASLVVNLFAIGGLVGGGAALIGAKHGRVASQGRPILRVAADLPPAERERFRQSMRRVINASMPLQRTGRENRTLAAELFQSPNFDAAAVGAALKQAREADFAFRVRLEEAVVAFASTLPAGERAAFARGLARNGPLRRAKTAPAPETAGAQPAPSR